MHYKIHGNLWIVQNVNLDLIIYVYLICFYDILQEGTLFVDVR